MTASPAAPASATHDFDLLIIGGGLVGASLACALAGRGLRIGLVEARPFQTGHPSYDDRTLALAHGTRRIFEGLGLWRSLGEVSPIHSIHISDRGHPGIARLEGRDHGVEALGYVVPARVVGAALLERLATLPEVEILSPARLSGLRIDAVAAVASLETDSGPRTLRARLVVGADGARSRVRAELGIPAFGYEYGQSALVANVSPAEPHRQRAFERFTDSGPLALLPLGDNRCAMVWTARSDRLPDLLALSDEAFLAALQQRFGDRLGAFVRVGRRESYPLSLVKAGEHARHRVALLGNAAHTLHPVAGQGFNLGLRDVAALAEVIHDGLTRQQDIGEQTLLTRYADWRRWDQRRTVAFTDGLTRLFSHPAPSLRLARNLGLLAFDLFPPAKRLLARQTMGLTGNLPRLALGLPLDPP
mgnify:CR=1 FL=1